jgi:ribosomal protection tetracycline resistance protein
VKSLNLGILAHVDAGKTSLTERLLHAAGVVDEIGNVDDGNTHTDTLALEQERGITIRSAVVSFTIDDVRVNLIDTPGHSDFIAEVERALAVLDGAVLVVSAVEGVQAQTRVLMRALQRIRIPTLLFINKIDRAGADPDAVLASIRDTLTPHVVSMATTREAGSRVVEVEPYDGTHPAFAASLIELLAAQDDEILSAWVEGDGMTPARLRAALRRQTRRALVHPVFVGSARTGTGVATLSSGIADLLPSREPADQLPLSATVFKVERGRAGEKVAYLRICAGRLQVRERVPVPAGEARVTAVRVFEQGAVVDRDSAGAGEIAQVWGLASVQVGDAVGAPPTGSPVRHRFSPPSLETVVDPVDRANKGILHAALTQLAEQDPLINVRQDDEQQEISVSLYGEVQKEVIGATPRQGVCRRGHLPGDDHGLRRTAGRHR